MHWKCLRAVIPGPFVPSPYCAAAAALFPKNKKQLGKYRKHFNKHSSFHTEFYFAFWIDGNTIYHISDVKYENVRSCLSV